METLVTSVQASKWAQHNQESGTAPAYMLAPNIEMPTIEVDGNEYVGYIHIPSLDLELPVLNEWSYPGLKIAPCRYVGSAYSNDLVIAAHNYKKHFGGIKNLNAGDVVTFTDVDNNVFNYKVALTDVLEPTATEEMVESDYDLTLFTCTLGGTSRVTVRCTRDYVPCIAVGSD